MGSVSRLHHCHRYHVRHLRDAADVSSTRMQLLDAGRDVVREGREGSNRPGSSSFLSHLLATVTTESVSHSRHRSASNKKTWSRKFLQVFQGGHG